MEDIDMLLTDGYAKFSQRIVEIHEERKALQAEFKKRYSDYNKRMKELEKTAKDELDGWENAKKEAYASASDG
tara:strand:+ start:4364 stop:4582 length:219 start_codon:yes stop_codon:yes gene_type:complete